MAPETCIDFDASHISSAEVFGTFTAAIGMLVGLYAYIVYYDPSESNPVAPRSTVIPPNTVELFFGMDIPETDASDEEEAEEEDDE